MSFVTGSQLNTKAETAMLNFAHQFVIYDIVPLYPISMGTLTRKDLQDAAGGFLKRQADLAILRGRTIIQNARDFYEFATVPYKTQNQTNAKAEFSSSAKTLTGNPTGTTDLLMEYDRRIK